MSQQLRVDNSSKVRGGLCALLPLHASFSLAWSPTMFVTTCLNYCEFIRVALRRLDVWLESSTASGLYTLSTTFFSLQYAVLGNRQWCLLQWSTYRGSTYLQPHLSHLQYYFCAKKCYTLNSLIYDCVAAFSKHNLACPYVSLFFFSRMCKIFPFLYPLECIYNRNIPVTIPPVLCTSFVDLLFLSPQRVKLKINMNELPTHHLNGNKRLDACPIALQTFILCREIYQDWLIFCFILFYFFSFITL